MVTDRFDELIERLGNNVGHRRVELDLFQHELAGKIGVTRKHVASIESGRSVVSLRLLARLAQALNTTVEELLREQDPATEDAERDGLPDTQRPDL
jgi:transcriptional regulator with XRE-family HTH domain